MAKRKRKNESPWFQINAKANDSHAEILIYGDIGESWWGESITAQSFVDELNALGKSIRSIDFRISSIGGSVNDGLAIFNAIDRLSAKTTAYIDGVAASISSMIPQACDTVVIAANGALMLHAPWGSTTGNSSQLRKAAAQLDLHSKQMEASYANHDRVDRDEIAEILASEEDHWFDADQALAHGLVDSISNSVEVAASLRQSVADRYSSLPRSALIMPGKKKPTPAPKDDDKTKSTAQAGGEAPTPGVPTPGTGEPGADNSGGADDGAGGADNGADGAGNGADDNGGAGDQANASAAPLERERARKSEINALFAATPEAFRSDVKVMAMQSEFLTDEGVTPQQASIKIMAKMGEGQVSANAGRVTKPYGDEADIKTGAMAKALDFKAGLDRTEDRENPYRGMSLSEMARASLDSKGIRDHIGKDKLQMVGHAFTHSSSDFKLLLANVAEKSMLKGFEENEETFPKWTAEGSLSDFKIANRVDINMFPNLVVVPEGGEFSHATIGERGETIQLLTIGRLFAITRQAIINDDLNAFTKVPRMMGEAVPRTIGDMVFAALVSTANMSDGHPLFDETNHGNNSGGTTYPASGITTQSVDAMRVAMRLHRDPDNIASALNIQMKYLLTSVANGGLAKAVISAENEYRDGVYDNTRPNMVRNTAEVIEDARFDNQDPAVWYGSADPNRVDTIEVAYLDGNKTPFMDEQNGWNVDGVEYKVRMDVGVARTGWRGLARNAGA